MLNIPEMKFITPLLIFISIMSSPVTKTSNKANTNERSIAELQIDGCVFQTSSFSTTLFGISTSAPSIR